MELKISEIVEGHYFLYKGETVCVTGKYGPEVTAARGRERLRFNIRELKPMPMSEGAARMLGMRRSGQKMYRLPISKSTRDGLSYHLGNGVYYTTLQTAKKLEHILYVHQFQSLYKALTGEVLKRVETQAQTQGKIF